MFRNNEEPKGFTPKNRLKFRDRVQTAERIDKSEVEDSGVSSGSAHNYVFEVVPQTESQIPLGIRSSRKEFWYTLRRRIRKLEVILEVLPYWKSGVNMFTLVFGFFSTGIVAFLVISNFARLKPQIPLFYSQTTFDFTTVDKSILLIFPVVIGFFNFMIIRLSMMVYNFDKKLVISMNLSLALINLLLIMALIQIISLILF